MNTSKRTLLAATTLIALTQIGATDCGQIITDPGFDLWCGADLCSWRLERGDIRQVPSWHQGDDAVELLGTDSAIYQQAPVNSSDGTCIRFSMIADVEDTAEVHLEMDVYGDGDVEYDQRIPTANWRPVSYLVRMPDLYQGVRFRLSKAGRGHAVLAQIGAEIADDVDCAGIAPLAIGLRPDGAWCASPVDCVTGTCAHTEFGRDVCSQCNADGDCVDGELCGIGDDQTPTLALALGCVVPAHRVLGERCNRDIECGTDICEMGRCGECRYGSDCDDGATCVVNIVDLDNIPPTQCAPGTGHGVTGAVCLINADCASGHCLGDTELTLCDADGRTCTTAADCPVKDINAPPVCVTVGVAGGTCQ